MRVVLITLQVSWMGGWGVSGVRDRVQGGRRVKVR